MKIIADRDSVCAADDINSHEKTFEIDESINMKDLIEILEENSEFLRYGGAIWAGDYDRYECVRNNAGHWKVNKMMSVKEFFRGIKNYIRFERNSKRCQ